MSALGWQGQVPCHLCTNGGYCIAFEVVGLRQAEPLKKVQRDHTEHGVMVQTLPGPPLEVVQADFFLQFPVGEFTRPAPFGDFNQPGKCCLWWEIAGVVFALLSSSLFPDDPSTLTRQMLTLGVLVPICQPDVDGGEAARQWTFGAMSPDQVLPGSTAEDLLDRLAVVGRGGVFGPSSPEVLGNGDQSDILGVGGLCTSYPDWTDPLGPDQEAKHFVPVSP